MNPQINRNPWQIVWQIAISDGLLIALLLVIAITLLIAAWLPQTPIADAADYAQWLSDVQEQFGPATPLLQSLGLFSIKQTFTFRLLLALLAMIAVLRIVETASELETPRLKRIFSLATYSGTLLILSSLLINQLWGWQIKHLVLQENDYLQLSDTRQWVAIENETLTHSAGVQTSIQEQGPGVQVTVFDINGEQLALQQTARSEPVDQITLAITEDKYFAIPQAQLIGRLTRQAMTINPATPVLIQIYRSPAGTLETQVVFEDQQMVLTLNGVTIELTRTPYIELTATHNPGRWNAGLGIVLLAIGILGTIIWGQQHKKPSPPLTTPQEGTR